MTCLYSGLLLVANSQKGNWKASHFKDYWFLLTHLQYTSKHCISDKNDQTRLDFSPLICFVMGFFSVWSKSYIMKQWKKNCKKEIKWDLHGIFTWEESLKTCREKRQHWVCGGFVECNKSVHQGLWNGGQLESAPQQSERAAPSKTIIWCIIHSVTMESRLLPPSRSVSPSHSASLMGSYGLPWRLWWSLALSITHSSAAAWGLHNSMTHSPTMSFKSRTKSVLNRGSCRIVANSCRTCLVTFLQFPRKGPWLRNAFLSWRPNF